MIALPNESGKFGLSTIKWRQYDKFIKGTLQHKYISPVTELNKIIIIIIQCSISEVSPQLQPKYLPKTQVSHIHEFQMEGSMLPHDWR